MKIEMVKFMDGKYGIRKTNFFFFKRYKDLYLTRCWSAFGTTLSSCKGSFEDVKQIYLNLTDKGTPIDIKKGEI